MPSEDIKRLKMKNKNQISHAIETLGKCRFNFHCVCQRYFLKKWFVLIILYMAMKTDCWQQNRKSKPQNSDGSKNVKDKVSGVKLTRAYKEWMHIKLETKCCDLARSLTRSMQIVLCTVPEGTIWINYDVNAPSTDSLCKNLPSKTKK